jgi:hypothetical protein
MSGNRTRSVSRHRNIRKIKLFKIHKLRICIAFCFFLMVFSSPVHLAHGESSVRWSPDGKWFTLRQEITNQTNPLDQAGWLFQPGQFLKTPPTEKLSIGRSTLWIGSVSLENWYKLAETGDRFEFLTQPAWAPDGLSIFFAGIEKLTNGSRVWRVFQVGDVNDLKNPQIIWEKGLSDGWTLPQPGQKGRLILSQIQAGVENLLIFCDPSVMELVLYRATTGEIVARFSESHNAKISPNGDYVFWLRSAQWPATDAQLGQTRVASGLEQVVVEKVLPDTSLHYSVNSPSLFVTRHVPPPNGFKVAEGTDWPEICRVLINENKHERFIKFDPIEPKFPLNHITFSINAEEDTLIHAVNQENRPVEIVWFLPKTSATYKKFPPLDMQTQVASLSISAEKLLAMRFGKAAETFEFDALPAGLIELGDAPVVVPLVPDEPSQKLWAELVIKLIAKTLYQDSASTGMSRSGPISEHFSLVPRIGEFQAGTALPNRLDRFAKVGFRAIGLDPARPDFRKIQSFDGWKQEAALLFLILTNHHREASELIENIDFTKFSQTARGRFFALKAQEKIETGDQLESQAIIESLRVGEAHLVGTVEFNAYEGWRLESSGKDEWADYLQVLQKAAENPPESAQDRSPLNPFGHFNPDDPATDPDLRFPKINQDDDLPAAVPNRPAPLMRTVPPRGVE